MRILHHARGGTVQVCMNIGVAFAEVPLDNQLILLSVATRNHHIVLGVVMRKGRRESGERLVGAPASASHTTERRNTTWDRGGEGELPAVRTSDEMNQWNFSNQ
jgi:hypothetical protein